jgi:acetyltransferase-like isoleucine patch superfamily enzyme
LLAEIRTRCVQLMYIFRRAYYVHVWQMDIGKGVRISLSAKLDKTAPKGLHIGQNSCVLFGAAIITHDFVNARHLEVRIGENCLIGAKAIVMPGVTIGNNCIIAPASVVMRDVPAGSVVVGNPARVVESGIVTGPFGMRAPAIIQLYRKSP